MHRTDALRSAEEAMKKPLDDLVLESPGLAVRVLLEQEKPWDSPFLALVFAATPAGGAGQPAGALSLNGFWSSRAHWIDDTPVEVSRALSAEQEELVTSFVEEHRGTLRVHRLEAPHPPGLDWGSPFATFVLYEEGRQPLLVCAEQGEL